MSDGEQHNNANDSKISFFEDVFSAIKSLSLKVMHVWAIKGDGGIKICSLRPIFSHTNVSRSSNVLE